MLVDYELTWDQALFSFRFVNNIPLRMYENRSNWASSQVNYE